MGFRLALLILFFLAVGLVARGILRKGDKGPASPGRIVLGHLVALLFGVIISPHFFSFITPPAVKGLVPILEMAFGWVGFLFGFQFNITTLRRIPGFSLLYAVLEASIAFGIAAFVAFFIIRQYTDFLELAKADVLRTALALGAALSISSPTLLGLFNKQMRVKSPLLSALIVAASVDGLVGVFVLGAINIVWHPARLEAHLVFLLIVLLGFVQAILLWLLLRAERKAIPTATLGIGVLTLGAGISAYLGLAPVVPGVLAGVIAANLAPGIRQRLAGMLYIAESGLYIGLIILAGVFLPLKGIEYRISILAWIALVGVLVRFLGKTFSGRYFYRLVNRPGTSQPRIRDLFTGSLQSAGALTLVVAFCYSQTIAANKAPVVIMTALFVFIAGEMIGALSTPRLLDFFREK
jgi:hypothetical protein